jgi:hypothetical protein
MDKANANYVIERLKGTLSEADIIQLAVVLVD